MIGRVRLQLHDTTMISELWLGVMNTYELQDSRQTLAEAITEYYAANPELVNVRNMSPEAQQFFRCHDAAHVVFGCGVALDDEAVVKIASMLGTTAGLGVLKGYRLHESVQIYKQLPLGAVLKSIAHSAVVVPRTLLRCLRQRARWPWAEFEQYLSVPLWDIRQRFGIVVPHGKPAQGHLTREEATRNEGTEWKPKRKARSERSQRRNKGLE